MTLGCLNEGIQECLHSKKCDDHIIYYVKTGSM